MHDWSRAPRCIAHMCTCVHCIMMLLTTNASKSNIASNSNNGSKSNINNETPAAVCHTSGGARASPRSPMWQPLSQQCTVSVCWKCALVHCSTHPDSDSAACPNVQHEHLCQVLSCVSVTNWSCKFTLLLTRARDASDRF